MKLLIVVRHAKASLPNVVVNDYNRPLTRLGIKDSKQIAQYLNLKKYNPDCVIASSATRTVETANIFCEELKNTTLQKNRSMYGTTSNQLLELIAEINDSCNIVMIVGHNPTITSLINIISDAYIDYVPTSGTGIIKFDISSWKKIINIQGKLVEFIYPKKLKLL